MPITKHNFIVKEVHDIASTLRRAFKIAKTGRPGPVRVDITKDATDPKVTIEFEPVKPEEPERITATIKDEDIDSLASSALEVQRLLVNNARPVSLEDARSLYLGLM